MKGKKVHVNEKDETRENIKPVEDADVCADADAKATTEKNSADALKDSGSAVSNEKEIEADIAKLKLELDDKSKKCEEFVDKFQRITAEFDNYKKRTVREKESMYTEAVCDVVKAILPVVDNLDRALQASSSDSDAKVLKDGIDLVFRQMKETIKKIGVEEISCTGASFDPELHNAVMHIVDESLGHNTVVEEFQKGYIYKEKVIRHSMVKVAN